MLSAQYAICPRAQEELLNKEGCMPVAQTSMLHFSLNMPTICPRNAYFQLCFAYAPKRQLCQKKRKHNGPNPNPITHPPAGRA